MVVAFSVLLPEDYRKIWNISSHSFNIHQMILNGCKLTWFDDIENALTIRNGKALEKIIFHRRHGWWEHHCECCSGTWNLYNDDQALWVVIFWKLFCLMVMVTKKIILNKNKRHLGRYSELQKERTHNQSST